MVSVAEKKESIRAAVQELSSPTSMLSACEAMLTLSLAVFHDFDDLDGSIGVFEGDDDFKEEIFSARVIQVLITVSQDKEEYPSTFYHAVCSIVSLLCDDNTELANAFVVLDGVEFLLETLDTFSSDQFLLAGCFLASRTIFENLNASESPALMGMLLGKLMAVFEVNYKTANEAFYLEYCLGVARVFLRLGVQLEETNSFQLIVFHVWYGVIKHKYDATAQDIGRRLLCGLVGEETAMLLCELEEEGTAKQMIDQAEMHHCA
jgi:hypothetical protein